MADVTKIVVFASVLVGVGQAFGVTGEKGPMFVKRSGNATLNCYIQGHDYDGLQHTIRWIKIVDNVQIPVSANTIVDSESPVDKYQVTPMRDLPSYYLDLQLKIFNTSLSDNGSYICEVLGIGGHKKLGRHSVELLVREQVRKLQLVHAHNGTNITSTLDTTIRLEYDEPSDITCQSVGGNPPPKLRVYLAHTEITERFVQRRMSVTYTGSPPWDQHFIYSSHITCPSCRFKRGDHGKLLQCESTVDGFDNIVTTSRQLAIYFKPMIECNDSVAPKGATNFHISCKIRANPEADDVQWLVGSSLVLPDGYSDSRYSVVSDEVPPTLRTSTLVVAKVSDEHFLIKYVLTAKNRYGVTSKTLMLGLGATPQLTDSYYRKGKDEGSPYSTSSPHIVAIGQSGYSTAACPLMPSTLLILVSLTVKFLSR